MKHTILHCLTCAVAAVPFVVHAEQTLSLKQVRDGSPAINLSGQELAELGDPFFNLVLKEHADLVSLSEIENRLQPDATKRKLFVVDEHIMDATTPNSRRSVTIFQGSNGGEILNTNVMLSIFFSSEGFPESPDSVGAKRLRALEAWGWDNHRGRYNYYKLDATGTPTGRMTWKFRGSSEGADLLTPSDRGNTCMACHVNGGPIMKELFLPWNNWHSFKSEATYLKRITPANQRWPVTADSRLQRLESAENLEIPVLEGLKQFNTRRINAALKREDATGNIEEIAGKQTAIEGRRLLRHLFFTTEFNIISATVLSGVHPLGTQSAGGLGENIAIPNSFFLNTNLIGGGGSSGLNGLGIASARNFSNEANAVLLPDEYKSAVARADLRILGLSGDANFAWFVPEPSFIDNNMVDQLINRGIVPGQFVAAVMAVDLKNPVLSDERASLFKYIPDRFSFAPISQDGRLGFVRFTDHELTKAVIAAIQTESPAPGSAAAKFLTLLTADIANQPVKQLDALIGAYAAEVKTNLDSGDAAARRTAIDALLLKADSVRQKVINDDVLGNLDETGGFGLFPMR